MSYKDLGSVLISVYMYVYVCGYDLGSILVSILDVDLGIDLGDDLGVNVAPLYWGGWCPSDHFIHKSDSCAPTHLNRLI